MKIQMVTLLAGPEFVLQPGEVADLPAAQADALIKGGYARPVPAAGAEPAAEAEPGAEAEVVEGAEAEAEVVEGAEAAVQPRARGRRG